MKDITFALYFGNRGFFPESLIEEARKELKETVEKCGYKTLIMNKEETNFGAVETAAEGKKYAGFLKLHEGEYDGVILCLANFGDESGAAEALKNCGVPILIQAYPDEIGKMDFSRRRDAFCGKFSIMDVFYQYRLPFTVFKPHTVHPYTSEFTQHLKWFAATCRIANGMKNLTVGAIGARTTAFKTIRFDELTLQKYGITTEALDLSELFMRVKEIKKDTSKFEEKRERLKNYTNWRGVPLDKFETLTKVGVAIDDIINEYSMDCIALRCWIEIERELGISPCVLLSEMNDRGVVAACELDVCNAVTMHALSLASHGSSTCLDWNNNYGSDIDKCILFHCGPVAQNQMTQKGQIIEHPMFTKIYGAGCGWGCNVGRIASSPMTFGSSKTEDGKLIFYIGEGEFTDDKIEEGYFGCAGVVYIRKLQDKLLSIGRQGFRHHVGITFGHVEIPVREAFTTYLNYEIIDI